MGSRSIVYHQIEHEGGAGELLRQRFAAIREEFQVPSDFPDAVVAEATAAADHVVLPDADETAVPFVTIDPPGSMDLDQAVHIERAGTGFRVRYAIADVPAFVRAGGAIDTESRLRGQTVYCPDQRSPLHPPVLSEGAASLLPDLVRPAYIWDMVLDDGGTTTSTTLTRAMVRSVRRYDYEEVQKAVDAGNGEETLLLLKEVGELRVALEQARGGASLPMPEQEIEEDGQGGFAITFRPLLPSEDWNAQISLMTGMAAADLMLAAKIGILRTMPDPDPRDIARFRRQANGAGVSWRKNQTYGEFLRTLDRTDPRHLALIHEATVLFRGAGYTPFDGSVPEVTTHAAIAAPYAHVTAPLRRLVDRFGLMVCEALSAGTPVPDWVAEALPGLPEAMSTSDRRTNGVERACTDAVEAAALQSHIGATLPGIVVDANTRSTTVQLEGPAVVAKATGRAKEGESVSVRVDSADITTGRIELSIV